MPDHGHVFFGYPSRPETSRETLAAAADALNRVDDISALTWEELVVSGQIVIDRITEAIAEAAVSVFDVTTLNENVLFEIGFAVGAQRPLWLVRDESDQEASAKWSQVGIVTDLGYERFVNSDEIVGPFMSTRPDLDHPPALADLESLADRSDSVASIFYMQGVQTTNPEQELTRLVEYERKAGLQVTIADARESSVEPFRWYVRQCANADIVMVHLSPLRRQMAAVHNARCGFVAGLARGMGRPVLMVADADYKAPFDYRDLLYRYDNARDCADRANAWLQRNLEEAHVELEKRADYAVERRRSSELASLRLGEHVAENESHNLPDYFVDTHLYGTVLRGGVRLFAGRKGTGKTATLLRATQEFEDDRRVLACSVQPSSYDLSGFERVMADIGASSDNRQVLIESFWKYLLYSQMALNLANEFASRPAGISPNSPEWELDQYLRGPGDVFSSDFGVRIDQALEALKQADLGQSVSADRAHLAGALHTELIGTLRNLIAACLPSRDRVAVLVDNLDASWDPRDDLEGAADLLLGLVSASRKIGHELERAVPGRRQIEVSVAVFLRSDIFERLKARAPEPDKISADRIEWGDEDTLLRVVGERYVAAVDDADARPQELWERYFTGEIAGRSPSAYVVQHVVPRPRDIVFWCNAALDVASRRGHSQVLPADVIHSEGVYSHHAVEALQVELGSLVDEPDVLVHAFSGAPVLLSRSEVSDILRRAGVVEPETASVVQALIGFTFLGVQLAARRVEYAGDLHQVGRLLAIARTATDGDATSPVYVIHPAFRSYLEIGQAGEGQQVLA